MAVINEIKVGSTTYTIQDKMAIPTAEGANAGELKTKYRIAKKDYTGGASTYWYYEICKLPKNDSGNYASAIISGRIGGWESGNMSYISALIWNRNTPGLAVIDVGGTAGAASSIWNICDLVLYTNSDGTATLYAKCANWFTFDLDLELFQSTASITYSGTKLTSVSGTLNKAASNTTSRMELINGELYVAGTKMSKSGLATDGPSNNATSGSSISNTGDSGNGDTGGPSNNATGASSATNTGAAGTGDTGAPSKDYTGASSATNTGNSGTGNTSTPSATTKITYVSGSLSGGVLTLTTATATVASSTHKHTGPSHSHTMSHTHSLSAHTHKGPSHSHTMSHTHSLNNHTHKGPSHNHSMSHTHHMNWHTHAQK